MKSQTRRKILFWSVEALILAALIYVCLQLHVVFRPVIIFISVVFVPLIISLFLFYMVNPLFKLLLKVKIGKHFQMPRSIAGLIIIFGLLAIVIGIIAAIIPPMIHETTQLIRWLPGAARDGQRLLNHYAQYHWVQNLHLSQYADKIDAQMGDIAKNFLAHLTTGAGVFISTATSVVVVAVTVPVMLYYMLKDGNKLVPTIQKVFVNDNHAQEAANLLRRMNKTLSSYIAGQAIECTFVAVGTSIGYLIINQPMAIVLGLIAGATNMIPYIGPYIGIAPALMVALAIEPRKIIWVIVVVIIVQQIDGNLIYPKVIGRSLNIHPLTIIILLLAAGNIAGIGGMILCVPTYAIVKTIVTYLWNIRQLDEQERIASPSNSEGQK